MEEMISWLVSQFVQYSEWDEPNLDTKD